jgi:hypothetical protein
LRGRRQYGWSRRRFRIHGVRYRYVVSILVEHSAGNIMPHSIATATRAGRPWPCT